MLDNKITKKIEDFVSTKPRSIQEIAQHLNKNWRTVDRYVQQIKEEYGSIDTRTFREGTRGALKIVYWASIENIKNSMFQEILEKDIILGRTKHDFSPFDIYQHVTNNKKLVKKTTEENDQENLTKFFKILLSAKKQIFFFSGNLSFINIKIKNESFFEIIEKLIKRNVSIKVVCRVDIDGKQNIEKLLSLNSKYKKELIEIRHKKQPLRATIIDNKIIDIKEVKEPTGKKHELNTKTFIFYTIKDKLWIEWLTKIFWKMFNSSIDANKRLEEIDKIY